MSLLFFTFPSYQILKSFWNRSFSTHGNLKFYMGETCECYSSPLILNVLKENPVSPICMMKLGNPYIFWKVYSMRWFSKNPIFDSPIMLPERSQKHFFREGFFNARNMLKTQGNLLKTERSQ